MNNDFGIALTGIDTIDNVLIFREEYITSTGEIKVETIENNSKFISIIKSTKDILQSIL